MSFFIKRNDTSPSLEVICQDGDGAAVDVTGASVQFHMKDSASNLVVDAAGSVVDGAAGRVKYDWLAADTDQAGTFKGEFEVTFSGGAIETFPNRTEIIITIRGDIA